MSTTGAEDGEPRLTIRARITLTLEYVPADGEGLTRDQLVERERARLSDPAVILERINAHPEIVAKAETGAVVTRLPSLSEWQLAVLAGQDSISGQVVQSTTIDHEAVAARLDDGRELIMRDLSGLDTSNAGIRLAGLRGGAMTCHGEPNGYRFTPVGAPERDEVFIPARVLVVYTAEGQPRAVVPRPCEIVS